MKRKDEEKSCINHLDPSNLTTLLSPDFYLLSLLKANEEISKLIEFIN